jgi:hypothetical protein
MHVCCAIKKRQIVGPARLAPLAVGLFGKGYNVYPVPSGNLYIYSYIYRDLWVAFEHPEKPPTSSEIPLP